jgi:hypothetical protein
MFNETDITSLNSFIFSLFPVDISTKNEKKKINKDDHQIHHQNDGDSHNQEAILMSCLLFIPNSALKLGMWF